MSISGTIQKAVSKCGGLPLAVLLSGCLTFAQDGGQVAPSPSTRPWEYHFQSTMIGQGVFPFQAEYSGANSLEPHGEVKETFSFDATGDVRLWHDGQFYADVLSWQGYGLSKTTGVAGFPSGEAYRLGKTYPDAVIARAYFQQTIGLGSLPGASRVVFTVGHFSAADIFDKNAYANDARTQFMNWALINNPAWDYPANSLGFTNGAVAELDWRSWAARTGIFQVSRFANALRMDWNLAHAWSWAGEVEKQGSLFGHPGAVRLLAYENRAHMGIYQESLRDPQSIFAIGQLGYRTKYGFGISLEQEVHKSLGTFARLGWNDGRNQTYEFTDVDRTASAGVSLKGEAWHRAGDTAAAAIVINGISSVHRQFLAAGGLGITVGDGKLDYEKEAILEAYYSFATSWGIAVSPDFQFVEHPAYNRDRGPASIYAVRFHWEK